MKWLLMVLAVVLLVEAVVETPALNRRLVQGRWSSSRLALKWLSWGGGLVCVGWFWSRMIGDDLSYSRWATAAAGLVTCVVVWSVVSFVASGPRFKGTAMGDLVRRRTVRVVPFYARLAGALFLLAVILGGGPDESGALLFLMFSLILSGSLERPAAVAAGGDAQAGPRRSASGTE